MATSERRQNYISLTRDKAIEFTELYYDLVQLQKEWANEDYTTTLVQGDFMDENEELTAVDIGTLINNTVANLTTHWVTYGANYTALLK